MQCLTSAAQRYRQNNLINALMGFLLTVRYGCHCSYSTVSFPSECKTSIQFPSRLWGFHGLDPWKPWKPLRSSNIMVSLLVDGHLLLLLLPVWEWSIFHAGASSHNEMLNNEIKHCIAPIGTHIFNPRLVFTVKVWSRATKSFFFFTPRRHSRAALSSRHVKKISRFTYILRWIRAPTRDTKPSPRLTFARFTRRRRASFKGQDESHIHPSRCVRPRNIPSAGSPPFRIHTRPFTPNGALRECRPDKDRKPSSSCFKQCWKMERNIKT